MVGILKDNVQQIYFEGCEEVAQNVVDLLANAQHSLQGLLEKNKCLKLRSNIISFPHNTV